MEAEDAPEERAAPPAPQPALPPASGSARFDIKAPLRVPRILKGRYITKEGRLLGVKRLDSEMHETVFQCPKSILAECMAGECAGRLRYDDDNEVLATSM